MMITLFYILSALYIIRINFLEVNYMGQAFESLVILGLIILLQKK